MNILYFPDILYILVQIIILLEKEDITLKVTQFGYNTETEYSSIIVEFIINLLLNKFIIITENDKRIYNLDLILYIDVMTTKDAKIIRYSLTEEQQERIRKRLYLEYLNLRRKISFSDLI